MSEYIPPEGMKVAKESRPKELALIDENGKYHPAEAFYIPTTMLDSELIERLAFGGFLNRKFVGFRRGVGVTTTITFSQIPERKFTESRGTVYYTTYINGSIEKTNSTADDTGQYVVYLRFRRPLGPRDKVVNVN